MVPEKTQVRGRGENPKALSVTAIAVPAPPQGEPRGGGFRADGDIRPYGM